jgi:sugar phosphate isomerase/epimerase
MKLCGFADEAGKGIDAQIKATQELGWEYIESRNIDGVNLTDITEEQFEQVYRKLHESGVKVACFGSAVANWGKSILEPMDSSVEETKRAIPRMKRLGCTYLRIMSFAQLIDRGPDDQEEAERFRRMNILTRMYLDEGLTPVHENCMNYGGLGWQYTLKLLENVPGLKLAFDTANPVSTIDHFADEPQPQSSLTFFEHVKDHVEHIHIKDCKATDQKDSKFWNVEFTWPGEGDGQVVEILKSAKAMAYDGFVSIEPHLKVVFHDESVTSEESAMFENYVEYGRRIEKILDDLEWPMTSHIITQSL